ncbi:VPLPA-CTERM sorting domain-containing protein [Methylotuvimicrobium sp. KM1]|uniref:VPLPA-CTERM sorting domain-containing protein n=1 Tax=Methylotuvimicrobium sp. KM1 TaxID=3377707 RepID=UPI00384C93E7
MNKNIFAALAIGVTALVSIQEASAHVGWNGRDLITDAYSSTNNGDGSTTYHFDRGVVAGNFGWADGLDADWGDSHRIRFTKFYLEQDSFVNVDVWGTDQVRNRNDDDMMDPSSLLADLNPAFSIYKGNGAHHDASAGAHNDHNLVPGSSFDWTTFNNAADFGKEGAFRALGDITMCNNAGECGTQAFTGYFAGGVNTTADSISVADIFLTAGWYSVAVGGTSSEAWNYYTAGDGRAPDLTAHNYLGTHNDLDLANRGFNVDLTVRAASLQPVPVPAAVWLMGSALVGLIGFRRRSSVA